MDFPFSHAVLLSFEGPDPYSLVGGLGTRVTELSAALAQAGVETTLIFVGDPRLPPVEHPANGLTYRRWCQWISAYHPGNVYDGEYGKVPDYAGSAPPFVAEEIVRPAAARGERVLVIAEDWQTAPAAISLDAALRERGLREHASLMWNANNTYGFDFIDWGALRRAACVTTVSRYMRFELWIRGIETLVIPNGIPQRLLGGPPQELVADTESALRGRPLLVKVGRFDEDKRWMQAIEAFAQIRGAHPAATLLVRGGREPYGAAVLARARELGLGVEDVQIASREPELVLDALAAANAPVLNVRSFVPEELLFAFYHVADAVLANSGKEPFGLVGLEVMASGGVAVVGPSGEDYAEAFGNAIVCDTGDPRELASYLETLLRDANLSRTIRAAGEATAERYTWNNVLGVLAEKAAYLAARF
ncbi:MAG TPA: glycosyltransferase family 4 protein [Verrucomicrobiae bacterium]|nr:glycosyltransferase family 4 protein [Verrucomicrobiae bacterium]